MNGFLFFSVRSGTHIFSKQYVPNFGVNNDSQQEGRGMPQDPHQLSIFLFALYQQTFEMEEQEQDRQVVENGPRRPSAVEVQQDHSAGYFQTYTTGDVRLYFSLDVTVGVVAVVFFDILYDRDTCVRFTKELCLSFVDKYRKQLTSGRSAVQRKFTSFTATLSSILSDLPQLLMERCIKELGTSCGSTWVYICHSPSFFRHVDRDDFSSSLAAGEARGPPTPPLSARTPRYSLTTPRGIVPGSNNEDDSNAARKRPKSRSQQAADAEIGSDDTRAQSLSKRTQPKKKFLPLKPKKMKDNKKWLKLTKPEMLAVGLAGRMQVLIHSVAQGTAAGGASEAASPGVPHVAMQSRRNIDLLLNTIHRASKCMGSMSDLGQTFESMEMYVRFPPPTRRDSQVGTEASAGAGDKGQEGRSRPPSSALASHPLPPLGNKRDPSTSTTTKTGAPAVHGPVPALSMSCIRILRRGHLLVSFSCEPAVMRSRAQTHRHQRRPSSSSTGFGLDANFVTPRRPVPLSHITASHPLTGLNARVLLEPHLQQLASLLQFLYNNDIVLPEIAWAVEDD